MRVLYVDLCPSPGGSIFSLFHLVSHLNRREVQPLVALAGVNPFTRFEEAGIPVVRVHTPRWERRPAGLASQDPPGPAQAKAPKPRTTLELPPADRWQTSKLGETMRHSTWGAGLWRTAGATRRLLRDCLLYTSPSPRDRSLSRMPSSA